MQLVNQCGLRLAIGVLVTSATLSSATAQSQDDPRATSDDSWIRELPDAEELRSGDLEPRYPDFVNPDGTVAAAGDDAATGGASSGSSGAGSSGAGSSGAGSSGSTSPTARATETEPNNSIGKAQDVAATGSVTGTIDPAGDYDWYLFEVERRGSLSLRFSTVPAGVQPTFRIHSANRAALTGWITPSISDGATALEVVDLMAAGRYYVALAGSKREETSSSPYTLDLRFAEGDRFEPNESWGTYTAVSPAARLQGTILPRGDVDRYSFEVDRRGAVEIKLTSVPAELDLQFRIHSQENAALTGWIAPKVRDGVAETVVIDLPAEGRYHIVLLDGDHDARSETAYTLRLDPHPGDANEPNESAGRATPIDANSTTPVSILPQGDYDWYFFEVERQGIATVTFDNLPDALDVTFRLHSAENAAITGWITPSVREGSTEPTIVDLTAAGSYRIVLADNQSNARAFDSFQFGLSTDLGDAHEPNASFGQATPIQVGSTVRGNVLPKGDHDWYTFEVASARTVEVVFTRIPDSIEPAFRMHNAEGAALTSWQTPTIRDGATTPVSIELKAPGRYYVSVADSESDARCVEDYEFVVR